MNANAYGGQLAAVLEWVDVCTAAGRPSAARPSSSGSPTAARTSAPARSSPRACFLLAPADPAAIRATLAAMRERRREAQPSGIKTFGSTFKNPEDPRAEGRTRRPAARGRRLPRAARRRRPLLREARQLRREQRRGDHRRRRHQHRSLRLSRDDQHSRSLAAAVRLLIGDQLHGLAIALAEIALARARYPQIGELLHLAAFRRARADPQAVRSALRRDGDLRDARAVGARVHIGRAQQCGLRIRALPPVPAEQLHVDARAHRLEIVIARFHRDAPRYSPG